MSSITLDVVTVIGTAIGAYLWLIIVLRISGKRSLAKLNAFDFAVTVAFGSTLSAVIVSRNVGLVRGGTALAVLALLQWLVSTLSIRWAWWRRLVRSRPTLLLEQGNCLPAAMRHERITQDEIDSAVRKHGYGRLADVAAVVLETDGSFSVIGKSDGKLDLLARVRRIGDEARKGGA